MRQSIGIETRLSQASSILIALGKEFFSVPERRKKVNNLRANGNAI